MENLGVDLNERDGDPKFYWALSSLPGHPGISKDQVSLLEPGNSSFFSASVAEVWFTPVLCHSWRQQARLITYRMLAWQDCCLSLGWPSSQRRGEGVGDVGEDHGSPTWSPQPIGQPVTQGELQENQTRIKTKQHNLLEPKRSKFFQRKKNKVSSGLVNMILHMDRG